MNILQIGIIIINLMILLLLYVKRDDILSFIFPNQYAKVIMLESDNSINVWIQKKSSDLRFIFNDGYYNLFDSNILGIPSPDGSVSKRSINIYRSGRLGAFVYVEGNENPIDLRTIKATGNPQLNKQVTRIEFGKLFIDDSSGFENLIKKFMPYLAIIGIILLIILVVKN